MMLDGLWVGKELLVMGYEHLSLSRRISKISQRVLFDERVERVRRSEVITEIRQLIIG